MRSSIIAAILLPLLAMAAPAPPRSRLPSPFFPRQNNSSSTCDLADTPQPSSTLTQPSSDETLVLIALGTGTQNYTCANSTAAPSAIGAVATLTNQSCAIANNDLGSLSEDAAAIGMHFFVDTTTPDFDITGLGNTELKKAEAMNAPNPSTDVPWLKLDAQAQGTTSAVKNIYRLNTKGGVAPATCAGHAAGDVITIAYSAQYWVYASTAAVEARRKIRSLGRPLN